MMIQHVIVKTIKELEFLYAVLFNALCSGRSVSKATIQVILKKCSWRKEAVDY